ncbi:hypothetical protein K469DRAFT_704996 [Zopfia rhizophila CBS 207.26]|uniref:Uncharacterized protein n=1 Tax=Zopfia rhizophila CBS 207.26 TaxID=1314779 RepID=A0A6A6E652_9PEZI|nr:hypothetical protein K469DRAFT_704996 [Zopfia rhizophila CBS 207.26]
MRTPRHLQNPNYTRAQLGQLAHSNTSTPTCRAVFYRDSVSIWAWPSLGGLVVLERATALDFDFLGLDSVSPPTCRDSDQDAEDDFCKRLLLLGAKWFDSEERYRFVASVAEDDDRAILALEAGKERPPTMMERRWVSVALNNGVNANNGLWVVEFETNLFGMQEKYNLVPDDAGKVGLAKTMDEKCKILKGMGAKFYSTLGDYDGAACLNMWEWKTEGELGPLLKAPFEEE